jgi:DNA polymerase-3 subunit delta
MAAGFGTFWDFENKLKNNQLGRLCCFLGEETFLRRRALALLRRKLLCPEDEAYSFLSFDLVEDSLDEFLNQARTISMLASQRLLVLKQAERIAPADLPPLEAYLQHPAARTTIVFEFDPGFNPKRLKTDKERKLLGVMERHTMRILFTRLKSKNLVEFLLRYSREENYRFERPAIEYLVERLGGDTELIVNEMEKLFLLAGPTQDVRREDMERLMVKHPYATIFDMLDALAVRNARDAVTHLATLLESGEHPLGILSMIGRFFQQATMYKSLRDNGASEREILGRISRFFHIKNMQSFQLNNLEKAHCNFAAPDLWHALALVGKAEEQFKSVHVEAGAHLELLLVRLCRLPSD